ncbi:MAG: EF-hand domain-containing protein [Kaiparowitsia implicata GSE-PSE-MK54-09C]|jgi:calmodulin|nr:EF-hand domain-containing protein [Kaiparowitsia implicata GSE-PSE-MK54-09C]
MSAENFNLQVSDEAKELLVPERLTAIQQAFVQMDTNQDGKIQLEEYITAMLELERTRLVDKFNTMDTDGDGEITFDEFLAVTEPHYVLLKKIREFDSNKNGLLSLSEAIALADKIDFPVTGAQLQRLLEKHAAARNGKVTYNELLGAMVRFGFQ